MAFYEFLLIGIALSMDAFSVSIANCLNCKKNLPKLKAWAMPITFGGLQFLMPVLGFYVGLTFATSIKAYSNFITAGVFFILGAKIIFDIVKDYYKEKTYAFNQKEHECSIKPISYATILLQGVLTAIDALIIGAGTFALKLTTPFIASLTVGITTFIIVCVGVFFSKYLNKLFGKYSSFVGAGILIALSIKELITALI